MNASQLLGTLQERGASVFCDGDTLRVSPSRVLDADLRAAIRCHKSELLELLQLETASQAADVGRDSSECEPRALYEPKKAIEFAHFEYSNGGISEQQRDALLSYAQIGSHISATRNND